MNSFTISNNNIISLNALNGSDFSLLAYFVPFTVNFVLKSVKKIEDPFSKTISFVEDNTLNYLDNIYIGEGDIPYDWTFIQPNKLKWIRINDKVNYVKLTMEFDPKFVYMRNNNLAFIVKYDKERKKSESEYVNYIYDSAKERIKKFDNVMDDDTCISVGLFDDCPIDFKTGKNMIGCMMWRRTGLEGDYCNRKLPAYLKDVSIKVFCGSSNKKHPDCSCYNTYNTHPENFIVPPLCWHKDCLFSNYLIESKFLEYRRKCAINFKDWYRYFSSIIDETGEPNGFINKTENSMIVSN